MFYAYGLWLPYISLHYAYQTLEMNSSVWGLETYKILQVFGTLKVSFKTSGLRCTRVRKKYEPLMYMSVNTTIEQLLEAEESCVENGSFAYMSYKLVSLI